jgi:hypothetical protein
VTLGNVTRFEVSEGLVHATEDALREAGSKGYELFVLWSGNPADETFRVEHMYVPTQQSYKLRRGVCVRVDAIELDRLNRWLYASHQILGVQVHTHPEDAYHSETDDTYPIVTLLGGLSIVAPNFCRGQLLGTDTAVFRLARKGWLPQSDWRADNLVEVVN